MLLCLEHSEILVSTTMLLPHCPVCFAVLQIAGEGNADFLLCGNITF